MGELRVRRGGSFAVPRYQGTGKTEKKAGSSPVQQTARRAVAVSQTLQQLMARVGQAEGQVQAVRRALQTGEASLAEVQDGLGRMEDLAQEAAGSGAPDRDALQAQLDQLKGEIDRILQSSGLFREEGAASSGALLDAVMDGLSPREDGLQGLPAWLLWGMADNAPDKEALLGALGLDSSATGPELAAALGRLPLEDSPAAGYLAALYLGAVIAGGGSSGGADPAQAAEGLRQLLEAVSQGLSPDKALEMLTGGQFTSLADFQQQFTGGTAPGLDAFLVDLLLTGDTAAAAPAMPSLLAMLAGGGGGEGLDLLMGLLAVLESAGAGQDALLAEPAPGQGPAPQGDAQQPPASPQPQAVELGGIRATGDGLSGVALDPETGTATVAAGENVRLQGSGQAGPALSLTGEGPVVLRQVEAPSLTVAAPGAQVASQGENTVFQLQLKEGAALTLEGDGLLRIGVLRGGAGSVLQLKSGGVAIGAQEGSAAPLVVVAGPVSLLAPPGITVQNPQGEPLTPFDIIWKTLLPDWDALTTLTVDGKQAPLSLMRGDEPTAARLWLLKEDSSHGFPAHAIILQGRDKAGRLRTRYVYLHWSQRDSKFQPDPLYPNPFTVTGGQPEVDWRYEEDTGTLRILTGQAAAISGGTGEGAGSQPFSGRIALADAIGRVELTLDSVQCRVPSGRAFSLGSGNKVALLLKSGSQNFFESGPGCAGISLGDGTSLRIDQLRATPQDPPGALTATGGSGSEGIGRDSGVGRELTGPILLCGGVVTIAGGKSGQALASQEKAPQSQEGAVAIPLPHFQVSAQSLALNTLDLSTREAARAAMETLTDSRRRVAQLQGAYRALYGQVEQRAHGLYNARRYARVLRDAGEAGSLLWDMHESLLQAPAPPFSPWDMDDVGQLLW